MNIKTEYKNYKYPTTYKFKYHISTYIDVYSTTERIYLLEGVLRWAYEKYKKYSNYKLPNYKYSFEKLYSMFLDHGFDAIDMTNLEFDLCMIVLKDMKFI